MMAIGFTINATSGPVSTTISLTEVVQVAPAP